MPAPHRPARPPRRAQAVQASFDPPMQPPRCGYGSDASEEIPGPLECIFRVFMTACVAARHVAGRGLPNVLPEAERHAGLAATQLTPYTMLVVASAIRRTESELRSYPLSRCTSAASSRRISRQPSLSSLDGMGLGDRGGCGSSSTGEAERLDDAQLHKALQVGPASLPLCGSFYFLFFSFACNTAAGEHN